MKGQRSDANTMTKRNTRCSAWHRASPSMSERLTLLRGVHDRLQDVVEKTRRRSQLRNPANMSDRTCRPQQPRQFSPSLTPAACAKHVNPHPNQALSLTPPAAQSWKTSKLSSLAGEMLPQGKCIAQPLPLFLQPATACVCVCDFSPLYSVIVISKKVAEFQSKPL